MLVPSGRLQLSQFCPPRRQEAVPAEQGNSDNHTQAVGLTPVLKTWRVPSFSGSNLPTGEADSVKSVLELFTPLALLSKQRFPLHYLKHGPLMLVFPFGILIHYHWREKRYHIQAGPGKAGMACALTFSLERETSPSGTTHH